MSLHCFNEVIIVEINHFKVIQDDGLALLVHGSKHQCSSFGYQTQIFL
jgi:hypothetical protein